MLQNKPKRGYLLEKISPFLTQPWFIHFSSVGSFLSVGVNYIFLKSTLVQFLDLYQRLSGLKISVNHSKFIIARSQLNRLFLK